MNNNEVNLHMTAEVWNAIEEMMNVGQLENFMETLDFMQDKLTSDEVITNCVDSFGGPGQVLLMINALKRMRKLFETINVAIAEKGGRL